MSPEERERLWTEKVRAREAAWTQKQRGKEEEWARRHSGQAKVKTILEDNGRGTWLDPAGDPAENSAFADAWGRMGRNRELAAVNSASVDSYDDPMARNFARMKARIASGSDQADAWSQYKLGQSQRRAQAMMQILGMQFGSDQASLDRDAQNEQARRARNAALWGTIGQIGAAAATGGMSALGGGGGSDFPRYNYMGSGRTY